MYETLYYLDQYAREHQRELLKEAQAYRLINRLKAENAGFQMLDSIGDALITLGEQLKVRSASRTTTYL
jgi:hypothetical protein